MGHAIEGALINHGLNQLAFFCAAMFQGIDHRHGDLAFAKITGDRLSQNSFGRCEVEDVIHDLESHAQVASIT